jgi:hypothetical protein
VTLVFLPALLAASLAVGERWTARRGALAASPVGHAGD